jgi:hypothetical protein
VGHCFLVSSFAVIAAPRLVHALDLTTMTTPGERQLVSLGGIDVLDWEPRTGDYRVFQYDLSSSGSDNPFPNAPVTQGTFQTVRQGHELVYLGDDTVLDWQPYKGDYRFFHYARGSSGNPLSSVIASGTFNTIRTGHKLVYLGNHGVYDPFGTVPEWVLDWEPGSGDYRIWQYDRTITGSSGNPFTQGTGGLITSGTWSTIHAGHEIFALDDGAKILDWEPASGHYRIFEFSSSHALSGTNPLINSPPFDEGTWSTIRSNHKLVPLDDYSRVIDWEPVTGHNRTWLYDSSASPNEDPLPVLITDHTWVTIKSSIPAVITQSNIKHLVVIEQ